MMLSLLLSWKKVIAYVVILLYVYCGSHTQSKAKSTVVLNAVIVIGALKSKYYYLTIYVIKEYHH